MPRKPKLSSTIYAGLKGDDALFKSVPHLRRKLLKDFAAVLADVLEAHIAKPLDYDALVAITAKTARRLSELPRSHWNCNALDTLVKLYSTPAIYEKWQAEKERLVAQKLNETARHIWAGGSLSCDGLARVYPQAYLPLTDMQP